MGFGFGFGFDLVDCCSAYWVLVFFFFFKNLWVYFTCLPSVGLFCYFRLGMLYYLLFRIDVALFCGLALLQFFFFFQILVKKFFWAFFFFFWLESRTNFYLFIYLRVFLILLECIPFF